MKYVTIGKFHELSGYSADAARQKIRRNVWLEGKEYIRAPDNRILMNLEGYEKWVESDAKKRHRLNR